ncbi:DUF3800 domain-containing protein [Adhaeribacter aquaticus]|uniref:DUF3800 domain-containing protein n=1 Tax=Adhaeribacter aquaticus TaxID=299567 RepID=UPI0004013636|nr:DUF3800 domain-containing protein [Adhaeribacter aquaticus]
MKNIIAFADEYGNNSFNFEEQGTHFIVASVIVPKDKLNDIESSVEKIRQKYFQKGEIKSSGVANNHKRRLIVLHELTQLDFNIYAVVVNKKQLYGEGFKYKGSFYKYCNGLVYRELYKTFPNLELVVDEHGTNDFMRGFKRYVHRYHVPTLFDSSEFSFKSSPDSVMIQLADFIAGTLSRCFDESKITVESNSFLEVLKPKTSSINYFPPVSNSYQIQL